MVGGSGNSSIKNVEDLLANFIFGPVEEREVHVILPILAQMGGGIRNLVKIGIEWGFTFTILQTPDAPMTKDISALPEESFVKVPSESEAVTYGLDLLMNAQDNGNEVAFLCAYNPASTYEQGNPTISDFELIGYPKKNPNLMTLNLCEGLIDSFEGYESEEDIKEREKLQDEFDKQKAVEEEAKSKTVKNVSVPRKRTQKKVEPQEPKPLEIEPEKPLEEPSEPDPRNELSATVPIVIGTPDIQEDIRAAHAEVEKRNTVAVSRDDLAELSQNIEELTASFGKIMDTFTRILKDG
jgi:hypothetical protein